MRLECRYRAPAAHRLTAGLPEGHKCRRLHGHNYEITITVIGTMDPATGMLMEFSEVDSRARHVLDHVDHRDLNALGEGATPIVETDLANKVRENPTAEHLARWICAELRNFFAGVRKVGGMAPQIYSVRVEEEPGMAVEVGAGEV